MKLRITTQEQGTTYYGHGKLLITGEYFVLDGAQALALPTRFGQSLRTSVLHASENLLYWVALNHKRTPWLNLVFDTTDFSCINSTQAEAARLGNMLTEARKLNPAFLTDGRDRAVETMLEFPNEWGLGSSSTLIHCLAKWADVDGYELLKRTIGGSGYDVACAAHDTAILYQLYNDKPETLPVHWKPAFANQLYFAYTGRKQLSSEGIKYYREKLHEKSHIVNELTRITEQVLTCESIDVFEELMDEHEAIIASALKMIRQKETVFADYEGTVKSLGAWGGDFVMLTHRGTENELKDYLRKKNISSVFGWSEIILD